MKQIILCADDYGQNRAISQAIIDLLKNRRLTATSCMVTGSDWPLYASWLLPYKNQVDIGLHFNLTEGSGLGFMPLPNLLLKSFLRRLNKKMLKAELNAQLDQFTNAMGMVPDFIDGHQHVHQFPQIRDVLLEVYEERLRETGCYIRCIDDPKSLWNVKSLKKLILQWSGAGAFKKQLIKRKIPHNQSFSGVYSFDVDQYETIFEVFLEEVQQGGLIMCHPGLEDSEDVLHGSRFREYAFFKSKEYLKLLRDVEVKVVRFKDILSKN